MDQIIMHTQTSEGFTLLEVMMALLISIIITLALYSTFEAQNKVYIRQQAVVEMQQNIRAGFNILNRDLRMAGFDPSGSGVAGFVNAASPVVFAGNTVVDTNATQISFTVNLDGDNTIDTVAEDTDGNLIIDPSETETISYRLGGANGTDLQRFSNTSLAAPPVLWQTVAENVEDLSFRYLDKDGNVTADLDKIKTVNVSMLVQSEEDDTAQFQQSFTNAFGTVITSTDGTRRRFLSSSIFCRNMGL